MKLFTENTEKPFPCTSVRQIKFKQIKENTFWNGVCSLKSLLSFKSKLVPLPFIPCPSCDDHGYIMRGEVKLKLNELNSSDMLSKHSRREETEGCGECLSFSSIFSYWINLGRTEFLLDFNVSVKTCGHSVFLCLSCVFPFPNKSIVIRKQILNHLYKLVESKN